MKKTLNETAIANELKGGSLFFANRPETKSPEPTETANTRTAERVNERTLDDLNGRTPERPNERTGERPNATKTTTQPTQRPIVRHSFQFYRDQLTQLKRLRAQKELQGEPCHLSDLVRQALDDFLKQANEHPNGRTTEQVTA